jgi:hypothetical protein
MSCKSLEKRQAIQDFRVRIGIQLFPLPFASPISQKIHMAREESDGTRVSGKLLLLYFEILRVPKVIVVEKGY